MKKIILLFLLICNLFSLTACDPSSFYYTYEDLKTNIRSVELIDYHNEAAKELFEKRDQVKPFDFSKMEIKDTLSVENMDEFLFELSNISFLLVWRHLDSPKGESVKINYTDGSFDIICCKAQFSCRYDHLGNVKEVIGSGGGNELTELIERLF